MSDAASPGEFSTGGAAEMGAVTPGYNPNSSSEAIMSNNVIMAKDTVQ